MTPLKARLTAKGVSLGAVSRDTKVLKCDVSNFVNGKIRRCSRSARSVLRRYFISLGLLAKPKPRPAPVCQRCGLEYPTRKQSTDQLPANQS